MTNLEKLLENDYEQLANALVKEVVGFTGDVLGYTGPHGIMYSTDPERPLDEADEYSIERAKCKEIIYPDGFVYRSEEMAREKCKRAILIWLKQSI